MKFSCFKQILQENDDQYYETVEKFKCSQNFAHYENIIDDENRVTSWTNLKARSELVKTGTTPQTSELVI